MSKLKNQPKDDISLLRSMFNQGEKNFRIAIERTIRMKTSLNKDEVKALVDRSIDNGNIFQSASIHDVPLYEIKY